MITLYRKRFFSDKVNNTIQDLLKMGYIKSEEIISFVVDDDQSYLGFEIDWATYTKLINHLTAESNALVDIILSSGNPQLHKCQLHEFESSPVKGKYIAIFSVEALTTKLLGDTIIAQLKDKLESISKIVRKDGVDADRYLVLHWYAIFKEISKEDCNRETLLHFITKEMDGFDELKHEPFLKGLNKLKELIIQIPYEKITLYSVNGASELNEVWTTLCKCLIKRDFIRDILNINVYLSNRDSSAIYAQRRQSWLFILDQLQKHDVDEKTIKGVLEQEIIKLSSSDQKEYCKMLQTLINTMSLNDQFDFPYYKDLQTDEKSELCNFVKYEVLDYLNEVNLLIKKLALEQKQNYLGFFNTAQNYHSVKASWMMILDNFQKEKKYTKQELVDLLIKESKRFPKKEYAQKLQQLASSLSDLSSEVHFPYQTTKTMLDLYNLQTVIEVEELSGEYVPYEARVQYKGSLWQCQNSENFLSHDELIQSRYLNKLKNPLDYQLKALYLWSTQLYFKGGYNYDYGNYETSHKIFKALVKHGYKEAYVMLCEQAYGNSFEDAEKNYQDIIDYCKTAPTACGPAGNFFAFVACIKLKKNLKEAICYLHQSAFLGDRSAWIALQCILFKQEAHVFASTEAHYLEIKEISVPESRKLAAEAIESLIINNRVPIQDTSGDSVDLKVAGFKSESVKDTAALLKALSSLYKNGSPMDGIAINTQKATKLENLAHAMEDQPNQNLSLKF